MKVKLICCTCKYCKGAYCLSLDWTNYTYCSAYCKIQEEKKNDEERIPINLFDGRVIRDATGSE